MTYKLQVNLSSRELLDDLIPKLRATENFLGETLSFKIQYSYDPSETLRLKNLKAEFELEITMIRMNLDQLLRRYSDRLADIVEGKGDTMLELDEHEAVAIESIRRLYQRSHELQTGSGLKANE